MDLFLGYAWPGNIRELQNMVERAVILAEDGVIRVEPRALAGPSAPEPLPTSNVLRQQERGVIETALERSRGRVSGPEGAAARLHLPASTLESKIRALGIDKLRFRNRGTASGSP
jgi:formate hydrogenlyase transcriptional activator